MIDFKELLDENQYKAVTSPIEGNKIIIASAGTGKTHTLTHRIAYLVEQGVNPNQILLLTFTNKAAEEMIGRAEQLLERNGLVDEEIKIAGGTFHSIAIMLYYKYCRMLNPELAKYTVINSDDSVDILSFIRRELIEVLDFEGRLTKEEKKKLPSAKALSSMISNAFNNNRKIEDIAKQAYAQDELNKEFVVRIEEQYRKHKARYCYYDFDDLLKVFRRMMKEPTISQLINNKFKYIFVDEVQDINHAQYDIITGFTGNKFLVGDAKQAIYGFRGSNSEYINKRAKFFAGYEEFYLRYNYRSCQSIIAMANQFIDAEKPILEGKENLICTKEEKGVAEIVHCSNNFEQTSDIVKSTMAITRREPDASIGILLRTNAQSQPFESSLLKENVSYNILCGLPFFSRRHVRDIVAFIKILHMGEDLISFHRVAALFDKVGPASAKSIHDVWQKYNYDVDAIHTNFADAVNGKRYADSGILLTNLYTFSKQKNSVSAAISLFYEEFYLDFLKKNFFGKDLLSRQEDVVALLNIAKEQDTITDFVAFINLMEQNRNDKEPSNITLLTVHKAKGLEFDYVFIPNVVNGTYPSERAQDDKEVEEDINVFYVALTRARKELYVYAPRLILKYGDTCPIEPSRYIEEIEN